ncbi:NYN domain-containing protein [Ramlibacter sp.]|uniref:NYN domain-containing protein n=1 Tax=Ramlibacter sp. TaxID=1917967 RepID=UPI0017A979E2|nr:NYN domain-containing protein [Ramlibacter sp.]MBA2674428.1 NYN domain-containing protein [Ramlibacter sp.]
MKDAMSNARDAAAAMLIDADNLAPAALEQAFAQLARQGLRVTLRRAYGGHEKLAGIRECLLRHGVRPIVNHGKGTTDVLLVVDAMDLLHASRLPPVVAIASSDADFAPLALRLREAGHWVVCFAQANKSADVELARCYDQLVYVDGASASPPAPAPAPAEEAPPAPRAARKAAPRKTTRPAAKPPAVQEDDPVRQVLESVEGFRQGRAVELNEVVKRLRDQKLLGKSASGPTFLKRHAPYVELSPAQQPNRLRLRANAD